MTRSISFLVLGIATILIAAALLYFNLRIEERIVPVGQPTDPIYYMIVDTRSTPADIANELKLKPQLLTSYRIDGLCLLGLAANQGRSDLVEFLLSLGADVNGRSNSAVGDSYYTPLYAAVASKRYNIIKVLIENGADPDFGGGSGITAREIAEMRSEDKRLADLIQAKD